MSTSLGRFVWYELMTTDMKAAEAFYRSVVGWDARDAGMPNMSYTLFSVQKTEVGGLMTLPKEAADMGARPAWIGYVAVDDVDAFADQVGKSRGAVYRAPADIPGVGRFAIVADPQGAVLALFKGSAEEPPAAEPMSPGHVGWHELYAADPEAAFAYYAKLFGWAKGETIDMGPMGPYQIFSWGGRQIGGMMRKPAELPMPFWQYYFVVTGIDAAMNRVQTGGGKVLNGPQEVPGGAWILQCLDPQGAAFALVGQKR